MPARTNINKYPVRVPEPIALFKGTHILQVLAVLLLTLNVALLYGIFFSQQGILGYHQQCKNVEELTAKVRKLKEDNTRLYRKIQSLKSDPLALEKLVRQQLGWARNDELVIDFVPEK